MTLRNFAKRLLLAPVAVFDRPSHNGLALTFDDGPDPQITARASSLLREAGARATFFLVGEKLLRHPELAEKLKADGHELASHSMTHPEMSELPRSQLDREVGDMYSMTLGNGEHAFPNRLFRPPKGVVTPSLIAYCVKHRIRMVFWNRDPEDYRASTEQILSYFEREPLQGGDIVLLHDKTQNLLAALPVLLDRARAAGLPCITVSEMLA